MRGPKRPTPQPWGLEYLYEDKWHPVHYYGKGPQVLSNDIDYIADYAMRVFKSQYHAALNGADPTIRVRGPLCPIPESTLTSYGLPRRQSTN